jgi:hypothetical protein
VFADVVRDLKATEQQLVGQLGSVRAAIAALDGTNTTKAAVSAEPIVRKRRRLSAKARAAISRAQKLRWAKHRAQAK